MHDYLQRWQIGFTWQVRALVALAGSWRVGELLIFARDVRNGTPWPALVATHPFYRFHPMLTPLDELYLLGAGIILGYFLWAWRGGRWAWPAVFLGPLLDQQGLPLGWGLLAIQPLLLLDAARRDCPRRWTGLMSIAAIAQLLMMYWGSSLNKDSTVWWENATALSDALVGDYLPTALGHVVGGALEGSTLLRLLTRLTVVAQLAVPLVFLLPLWRRFGRRAFGVCKILAIAFHLLIALLFHIVPFSLACVAFWLIVRLQVAQPAQGQQGRWAPAFFMIAFVAWGAGVLTGATRLHSDFLQRWSLTQSWRIMQRPEPRGHTLVLMPQWNVNFSGGERWHMAASWALASTPNLRREWLLAACTKEVATSALSVRHSRRKKVLEEYSLSCP